MVLIADGQTRRIYYFITHTLFWQVFFAGKPEPFFREGASWMNEGFGAVVVAAGNSRRMGGTGSKVFADLCGKPVLRYSLEALAACGSIEEICVVCRAEDMDLARQAAEGLQKPFVFVEGGASRQDSVWNGVQALQPDWCYLLIHDGARPFVTPEIIGNVCKDALQFGAATAAVPSKDTCKLRNGSGFVEATPPREKLSAVQTPQAFERGMYEYAARRAQNEGLECTDDCQLIEWAGGQVKLSEGAYRNFKLTTPEDMVTARAFLATDSEESAKKEEPSMRIGYGYDVHRLVPERALVLGGVRVPFKLGLLGHSDADVLTHAICDALLGAAALGDIGRLFPDTDPQYEGADSLHLLEEVCKLLHSHGYQIQNIDCTLIAQRPKVAPYVPEMRENICTACGLGLGQVSVKATTEEGLGFTGSGEGMAAAAVCCLK